MVIIIIIIFIFVMTDIINPARLQQRAIVITLLDPKSEFGVVHHNLIRCVLDYHHNPVAFQSFIASLNADFHSCIISEG